MQILPTGIQISPEGPLNMEIDDTQQFSAAVEDYRGTHPEEATDFSWEVIGGIGTIDENGLFLATTGGNGSVKATLKEFGNSDTVTITVIDGQISVQIEQPNGGEKIKGGSVYNITWNTAGEGIDHIHLL